MESIAESGSAVNDSQILLNAIHGKYFNSRSEGDPPVFLPVCWEDRKSKFQESFFSSIDDAAYKIGDLREQRLNTYFGDAPCGELGSGKHIGPRRLKRAVPDLLSLHFDLDWQSAADERKLKHLDLPPSILIQSGTKHHFQGWYTFSAHVPAKTYGAAVEAMNRQLCEKLGGDPSAIDFGHLLRAAGTWNVKNPQNPQLAEIVEQNRSYSYEELFDWLGKDFNPNLRIVSDETIRRTVGQGSFITAVERPMLESLYKNGLTEPHSRNRATLILIRDCYSKKMSVAETIKSVTEFLATKHNGWSEEWKSNEARCRANIPRQVKNWFAKAYNEPRKPIELTEADHRYIHSLSPTEWERGFLERAIRFIQTYRTEDNTVFLSARTMVKEMKVNKKRQRRWLDWLIDQGILAPKETFPKAQRKADLFWVLYPAQSPASA